jgi:hypothetical protein
MSRRQRNVSRRHGVKLRCNVACDLLQQYDGFFARLSSPRKDVTPNTIAEAHRFITKNANILVHQLKMSVIPEGTRCAGIYTPYYVTCFINGAATSANATKDLLLVASMF